MSGTFSIHPPLFPPKGYRILGRPQRRGRVTGESPGAFPIQKVKSDINEIFQSLEYNHTFKNYSSLPYGPFHRSDTLKNSGYPCFLMNSRDCRYFRYLYPFLAKNPEIMVHKSKSGQSAQVSNFRSLKQHNFMAHRALSISLSPSSYPNLQPLQDPSIKGRQVRQYAPQHPTYLTGTGIFPPASPLIFSIFISSE